MVKERARARAREREREREKKKGMDNYILNHFFYSLVIANACSR